MSAIERVIAKATRLVVPTDEDRKRLERVARKILSKLEDATNGISEVRGVLVGGSFAKGTWLPDDVDIDIFVKISTDVDERRFEEIGLGVGRRAARGYKYGKMYAQHPYTEATVDGVKVNIVPCYDVRQGEWRSAADRSQYHVIFVEENLGEGARTQVRLLKRFMRAVGVYGAEIEKEGFSGYAAEVLVYKHKDFLSVLRFFADLRPDASGRHLLLLDPIDSERDLARAISKETVARMMLASRAFLRSPSLEFFTGVKRRVRPRLERRVYAIVFSHKQLSEDTLWGELKRSTKQIVKHIEERGFKIARAGAASSSVDVSAILLLPETDMLPDLEERPGPEAYMSRESERFISKNRMEAEILWVGEDGRLKMLRKRPFTSLSRLLDAMLSSSSEIHRVGASREVADSIARSGRLLHGEALSRQTRKQGWLRKGLLDIISDTAGT